MSINQTVFQSKRTKPAKAFHCVLLSHFLQADTALTEEQKPAACRMKLLYAIIAVVLSSQKFSFFVPIVVTFFINKK